MLSPGPGKKLTIYVDETDKIHGRPVYEAVIDLLYHLKVRGLSVFRGIGGYGSDGRLHTAKMLELSSEMPIKIEAVDTAELIDQVLPEVCRLVVKGLVEVSDVNIIKAGSEPR